MDNQKFSPKLLENLNINIHAKILRALSILRNEFIKNYKEIQDRNFKFIPLDTMGDILSVHMIKFLREQGIEIVHVNVNVTMHIAYINQEIIERIDDLKSLIPSWIKWEYIKALFTMPSCYAGHKGLNIQNKDQAKRIGLQIHKMRKLFFSSKSFFPYGVYVYWPEEKMKPYYGNILFNDEKILKLTYSAYHDTFHANQYVIDATEADKNNIYEFISQAINIAIFVDCENVDPYRFASVFKNLKEENLKKIKKVILYDDINTSVAWDFINEIIHLPIVHEEISRVLNNKSLVDIAMAAGACKEYYQENTESLILASSDSDFWGLIQSLPSARYFVLNESDKTANAILQKFKDEEISSCFMDSFAQSEIQDFKDIVLYRSLQQKIRDFNETGYFEIMNPTLLVDMIFQEAHITGSFNQMETEKQVFYKKYIKNGMKITISEEHEETKFKMELIGAK